MMIGLDIGTDVIRACLFEGSFGRYTFSKLLKNRSQKVHCTLVLLLTWTMILKKLTPLSLLKQI